jgi:Mn2+/Fe2+ NRAMP family transporter
LPLLPLMFSSQVVNAVLLPLHAVALLLLARDERTMGSARTGTAVTITGWCFLALIVACVAAMTVQWL